MRFLLAFFLFFASAPTFSQSYAGCATNNEGAICDGEASAYANANRVNELLRAAAQQQSANLGHNHTYSACPNGTEQGDGLYGAGNPFTRVWASFKDDSVPAQTCGGSVAGQVYRDFLNSGSCPGGYGPDLYNLGECNTEQKCLARNASLAMDDTIRPFKSGCIGGCDMQMEVGPNGSVGVDGEYTGHFEYTGAACSAGQPKPITPEQAKEPPQQKCSQQGSFKFCIKPNGEHCYSGSAGRQNCWKPGETGEKTDGPLLQKRNAGPTEIPPNLNLANGDTLVKNGDALTKASTFTSSSGSVTTITTTTTNYNTVSGTNAGPTNQGESASGDGSGQEGKEGEENGLTGGTSCDAQPVATGDPILGSIALQTWKTRCQGEDNKSSGSGNCEAVFQCSGEEILCSLAMEKRKERCDYEARRLADTNALNAMATEPDGTEGINVSDAFHSFDGGDINENLLGGSGGGQCDFSFTLGGQSLEMGPEWWSVVSLIYALMVAMAYLWIARQLGA